MHASSKTVARSDNLHRASPRLLVVVPSYSPSTVPGLGAGSTGQDSTVRTDGTQLPQRFEPHGHGCAPPIDAAGDSEAAALDGAVGAVGHATVVRPPQEESAAATTNTTAMRNGTLAADIDARGEWLLTRVGTSSQPAYWIRGKGGPRRRSRGTRNRDRNWRCNSRRRPQNRCPCRPGHPLWRRRPHGRKRCARIGCCKRPPRAPRPY